MSNNSLLHTCRTGDDLRNRCEVVVKGVVAVLQDVEGVDTSLWVTTMRVAPDPSKGFGIEDEIYAFGTMYSDGIDEAVDPSSYREARREEEICLLAEMDSHETATWAGLLLGIAADYRPNGGGRYDAKYGVIVTTVGLPPLLALFVSRTVRDFYVAKLDEMAMQMFKTGDTPALGEAEKGHDPDEPVVLRED